MLALKSKATGIELVVTLGGFSSGLSRDQHSTALVQCQAQPGKSTCAKCKEIENDCLSINLYIRRLKAGSD